MPGSVWVRVPPPLLFVASFAAGKLADRVVPLAEVAAGLGRGRPIGIAASVAGALLAASGPILFLRHRTTIVPLGTARSLVTSGPYRVTRNPMYLGVALVHVGVAILVRSPFALAAVALPAWVLQAWIIPHEERSLAEHFGDEYLRYARRTRRWLGWRSA